jgi:tryptophan synthase alpha chain
VIVPDVPPDESGPLLEHCLGAGLALIPLLAPTSLDARIELACRNAGGFVYLVSVAGVTGARDALSGRVAGLIERVRPHTDLPLLIGFGISSPASAQAAMAAGADGVIIGSRALEVSEAGGAPALEEFVREIAGALASAPTAR